MNTDTANVLQRHQPRDRIVGMKHLFVLDLDVVRAAGLDDIKATVEGLQEMDLYRLPYDRDVYIKIVDQKNPKALAPDQSIMLGPYAKDRGAFAIMASDAVDFEINLLESKNPETVEIGRGMIVWFEAVLIVLLATKNAVKVTTENKLAKLGIGRSRNRFASTTTISMPHEMADDPDHPATGSTKAAHLRRGHIRRQPYGKNRLMEKKIWIAPIFVNADPEFVASRESYKFSGWH